ncbi:pyruvate formate lyase family protein, partial [Chloroflexota bacterium]
MVQTAEKGTLSERVRKEKEELLSTPAQIDVERLKFLLEAYRETEMQPTVMRRAKLFHRICSEKTIYIDDNPIVGTLTKYKYGAYPFPEEGCRWMKRVEEVSLQRGRAPVTPEVREWVDKAVEYWKDSNVFNAAQQIILQSRNVDIGTLSKCGVGLELAAGGTQLVVPDYFKVLNKGLRGIMAEIEEEEAKFDIGEPGGLDKWYFYQASRLVLNGMMVLAQRYAALAREMARNGGSPERKQELEKIAETCEWVPANPARNFYEAAQSFWFTMLGVWIERPLPLNSPPVNFPQYMYPFYKKDKEENRLTDEEVIELIQFLFLRMNHFACLMPPHGYTWQ